MVAGLAILSMGDCGGQRKSVRVLADPWLTALWSALSLPTTWHIVPNGETNDGQ